MRHFYDWSTALIVALLASFCQGAYGSSSNGGDESASAPYLPANGTAALGKIDGSKTAYYRLNLTSAESCTPTKFLNVEAVNVDRQGEAIGSSVTGQPSIMLMVNWRGITPVAIPLGLGQWKWNDGTVADYQGYRLVRAYELLHFNLSQYDDHEGHPWMVGLMNDDSLASHTVNFSLRAWCSQTPACPLDCHGVGQCNASGMCECPPGRGGRGCGAIVKSLVDGAVLSESLGSGSWNYYVYNLTDSNEELLVEMWRTRGDPVLFAKRREEGFVAGGVPTVFDFGTFADSRSFRERSDYHFILRREGGPDLITIGVFNNDIDFQETAEYQIVARAVPGSAFLCPLNCSNPQGFCSAGPDGSQCSCTSGYEGQFCQGTFQDARLNEPVGATLEPGGWAFVRFTFDGSFTGNLVITFYRTGGQAILIAKQGSIPALDDNEYRFTTLETNGSLTSFFNMYDGSPQGTTYNFAVYNMDYYVHSECRFSLTFSLSHGGGVALTASPVMAIILSLVASISLCICMGICRAIILHHQRRRGAAQAGADGEIEDSGFDPKEVAAFPTVPYRAGLFSVKDDAQCPICLGEYEQDDVLRQLPKCSHYFHISCVDAWLTKHTTCPVCRTSLRSEPPRGFSRLSRNRGMQDGLEMGRSPQDGFPGLSRVMEESAEEMQEILRRPGKEAVAFSSDDSPSDGSDDEPVHKGVTETHLTIVDRSELEDNDGGPSTERR